VTDHTTPPDSIPDGYKRCARCKQYFPATIEYFHASKRRKSGIDSYCKPCYNDKQLEWARSHPDSRKKTQRKYYDTHIEQEREKVKRWRESNQERHRENNRRWREQNKEHHDELIRQWVVRNKDRYNEKARQWRAANQDKIKEAKRRRYSRNLERYRLLGVMNANKRRARLLNASGSYSEQDIADIRALQNDRCLYCGCELNRKGDIEHFIPVSRGGRNSKENLALACSSCNSSKHAQAPWNWQKWNGAYPVFYDGRLL
jgi:CRISPR/Cas system Type II protein with McrA/HNH and RuvC-like nuclease domain